MRAIVFDRSMARRTGRRRRDVLRVVEVNEVGQVVDLDPRVGRLAPLHGFLDLLDLDASAFGRIEWQFMQTRSDGGMPACRLVRAPPWQ
jgi:hypothetical protein